MSLYCERTTCLYYWTKNINQYNNGKCHQYKVNWPFFISNILSRVISNVLSNETSVPVTLLPLVYTSSAAKCSVVHVQTLHDRRMVRHVRATVQQRHRLKTSFRTVPDQECKVDVWMLPEFSDLAGGFVIDMWPSVVIHQQNIILCRCDRTRHSRAWNFFRFDTYASELIVVPCGMMFTSKSLSE